ncbi:MAG: hypothetical protein V4659_10530 [Pseudomonadota bacterium]
MIAAIVWGARQKRIRAAAEEQGEERSAETAEHPQAAAVAVEPPVSPAPPPLGDADVAAPPAVSKAAAGAKPAAAKAKPSAAKPATATAATQPAAKPSAAEPAKKPAAVAPAVAATEHGLIDIKGLGPKAVPLLAGLGINDLSALAKLSPARAAEIDGQLGALSGRMARDRWVEQAKLLAAGDVAAFEKTYGKL